MKNTPNRTFWQRIFGIHPESKKDVTPHKPDAIDTKDGHVLLPSNFWAVLSNPANDGKKIILQKTGSKITIVQTIK
jgi:hypothetical protein